MTVAFNLSQLANYVNSSGQLDASTGLVNATPVANGGSGRSTQTAYAVICGGTTTTSPQQSVSSVGSAGQVLTSNGAGALPTFQAPTGSSISTMDVKTSGTSATWTIPAGVTKVRVTVVGGGGNGGALSGSSFGGGGAGGGAAIKVLTGLTSGNTLIYTVGAGGGGTGATSSVSSGTQTITTISATGGANGTTGQTSSSLGGIGSNGDLNLPGGPGMPAYLDFSASTGIGGQGGSSIFGVSGPFGASGSSGGNGRGYGAGGSGSAGGVVNGFGSAGVVIFEY